MTEVIRVTKRKTITTKRREGKISFLEKDIKAEIHNNPSKR